MGVVHPEPSAAADAAAPASNFRRVIVIRLPTQFGNFMDKKV